MSERQRTCMEMKMKFFNLFYLWIAIISCLFLEIISVSGGVVFCYYDSSSIDRLGKGRFGVHNLPTNHCSHIVYSFLGLTPDGEITLPPQKTVSGASNTIKDFAVMKEANPEVYFMVAIGGFDEGSTNFSEVASSPASRQTFVDNVMSILIEYEFHGVDLNWQYPTQRGGLVSDKDNFILLLEDLRKAMSHDYVLTVAVGVTKDHVEESYDVPSINYYVDYINLMTYDYHGLWDPVTGVNAPLYPQVTDRPGTELNVNASVHFWLENGADDSKLVLGLAPFGKTFQLTNLKDASTGADYIGSGAIGPYTQKPGVWATYEICEDQIRNSRSWKMTVAPKQSYVYANKELLWIGYDSPATLYAKAEYAKLMGLGGLMFWSVDMDDFNGICGTEYLMITQGLSGFYSD